MSISSNTLFHFTKSLNNIKGIIKEGFRPHFSEEYVKFGKIRKRKKLKKYSMHDIFPMVSFCDVPLSQTEKLIESYGNYALGMSKKWGERVGANPVLYLQEDSLIARTVGQTIYDSYRTFDDTFETLNFGLYFSAFIKP